MSQEKGNNMDDEEIKFQKMEAAVRTLLECIGENPDREGLIKTPRRMAKALIDCTVGYETDITDLVNDALFNEDHDEMVIVKDIELHSMCEHHVLPFFGVVHIGYIPNGKVLGLSKLARIADAFSRRLQVQERLTRQIVDCLMEVLAPKGVAVCIEAKHMCMCMRGVRKANASTTTSSVAGVFKTDARTRSEFFMHIRR